MVRTNTKTGHCDIGAGVLATDAGLTLLEEMEDDTGEHGVFVQIDKMGSRLLKTIA